MKNRLKHMAGGQLVKLSLFAALSFGLSGCVYDVGLGYASDGYDDDAYECDPYGGYDSYYQCDYGHGFYNIGYGGGWYDSYWYPGYGFYLFDNVGHRYPMRDHHRRYWGEKRHNWVRENQGRYNDGGRYNDHGRGEGHHKRNRRWSGGEGTGVHALPVPHPEVVQRPGRARDRGDRFRNGPARGDRAGRALGGTVHGARPQPAPQVAPPVPRAAQQQQQRVQPQRPPAPRPSRMKGENIRD